MTKALDQMPPRTILAATFLASALPMALVVAFPGQLNRVIAPASYAVFHNIAEFFSIMVSLSIFGVGWFTFEQSKDRHALFLSAVFLAIGLMDFMHTLSNAAMPAFITANSSNKSTQFWIAARLLQVAAFLVSAYIYPTRQSGWLSKTSLMTAALLMPGLVFAGITFFPSQMPDTFIQGVGLTPFKKISEYLVVVLLCISAAAYWRRMERTGNRALIYYLAAFIVSIFGELNFAVYTKVFDTYNVLGHVYKVAAFYLIYRGIFIASVKAPYEKLADEEHIRHLASFPQLNPNPVMEVDVSGKITFCNPATGKILESLGSAKGDVSLFLPGDMDGILRGLDQKKESLFSREVTVKDRVFGESIYLAPQFNVVRIYAYDISERKRAEEAVRKAKEELDLRVQERTAELERIVNILHGEIRERVEAEARAKLTNALLKLYTEKSAKKQYLDSAAGLIRGWSGCRHIGARVTDKDGNIPYESCAGFNAEFLESENMLSLTRDHCACTRVVAGTPEPQDMAAMTPDGSFYCNHTMKFMEGLTGEQKARFRGVCVRSGFTSVAVIPIRYRDRVLGAIHLADEREGMVPLRKVEFLEQMAFIIGEALFRFGVEDELRRNYGALKASIDLLENMFTSLHVMIAYMDRDFNFIRVNRAYAEADGREPEFYPGKNHFELFPYGKNEKIFRRVVETGEPYFAFERAFEYAEHPERGVSYWDWSLVPVREADGGVSGTVLSLIDVTERKRAEERAALFRNLVNQSSDAVFVVDPETSRILEINDAACSMSRYGREELLAMTVADFAENRPDPSSWKGHVAEVRKKGVVLLEDRLKRKDGGKVLVEVSVTIAPHEKKEYLVAAVRDITERKRAEEERARLASAVDSTADAVVITEAKGIIRYINPAFEQITGFTKDEAVGRTLHILDSGKHDEAFYRELRETLARDGVWSGRLINRKKNGSLYFEDCSISSIKGPSGAVINYVAIKRDVTEKLRLESIAESVNTMDNIGYVFSGVRHEIGNPINSAKMILSVLQHKLDTIDRDAVRDYVDRSLTEIGRVEHLLKSLKNYNLYETPELAAVDLNSFLGKFFKLIAEDFKKKGIALSLEVRPGADRVEADPRALQQVLLNLVTNAADALAQRADPRISVVARRQSGRILLEVADNGCGITEEQQRNLFRPFYTSKPRGTGLGLVIVKKMLANMNGSIEITSLPNRGTTANISLPEGTDAPAR